MAVLARRAAWRGHELEVRALGADDQLRPGEHDLYYIGGGQDREQELIAPALAAHGEALRAAAASDLSNSLLLSRDPVRGCQPSVDELTHRGIRP